MAATLRVEVTEPDAELDLVRDAIIRLAERSEMEGSIAISRRSTTALCAERPGPVVPILLDGRGILVGPVLQGEPGCPCCAVARRQQHGLGSGAVDPAAVMVASGRTMTAATAWIVAVQALALLRGITSGPRIVRDIDPRTASVRTWQLTPNEECHCAPD